MKKKGICLGLAAILIFTFSVSGMAFASSQSELEEDLASVENERDEVSQRLSEVMDQIETLQPQVDALDAEVAEANSKIVATENEIAQKEEEMRSREDGLNERLRVMYKNGSVGFIDVLLGSNSISEFISNLDLIQRIYKNDMEVLETLQKEHEELEDLRAELQQDKADLDQKRAELESQVAELDSLKAELEAKEDELLAQAEDLNQQIQDMIDTGSDYVGGGSWVWPAPASHYLTSYFGWRIHPVYGTWKYHSGIDIAASSGAECPGGSIRDCNTFPAVRRIWTVCNNRPRRRHNKPLRSYDNRFAEGIRRRYGAGRTGDRPCGQQRRVYGTFICILKYERAEPL